MTKIVAVIPARGGSKGVPRKNIKLLADKPMIAWTIEAALESKCLGRIIVSTEDDEIATVARSWGAETPFLRPPQLASDTASVVDVVLHALDWLKNNENFQPELVLLLQPTSPLQNGDDIRNAIALQKEKNANAVVSVCVAAHPPHWLRRIGARGELLPWLSEATPNRRQEVEALYQFNGALYLIRPEVLVSEKTFVPEPTFASVMPLERSIDVDTPFDFYVADLILRDLQLHAFR